MAKQMKFIKNFTNKYIAYQCPKIYKDQRYILVVFLRPFEHCCAHKPDPLSCDVVSLFLSAFRMLPYVLQLRSQHEDKEGCESNLKESPCNSGVKDP